MLLTIFFYVVHAVSVGKILDEHISLSIIFVLFHQLKEFFERSLLVFVKFYGFNWVYLALKYLFVRDRCPFNLFFNLFDFSWSINSFETKFVWNIYPIKCLKTCFSEAHLLCFRQFYDCILCFLAETIECLQDIFKSNAIVWPL